jgi:large subunit ribosomal protein L35Ae
MKGVIKNYRRGRRTQKPNQVIVEVKAVKTKKSAGLLIGKKVTWKSPAGKELVGKVVDAHGNGGALRVRFNKGVPGQAIGQQVSFSE